MRRMDRLSYLLSARPGPLVLDRGSFFGRAGLVAVAVFLVLVAARALSDASSSTRALTASSGGEIGKTQTLRYASTNAPKAYAADKGQLLGTDAEAAIKVVNSSKFKALVAAAKGAPRLRKMIDLTKDPQSNPMQVLLNTWTAGSYSPVHRHPDYSEAFVVLQGTLAFFTFSEDGKPTCHLLSADGSAGTGTGTGTGTGSGAAASAGAAASGGSVGSAADAGSDRAIVVEKGVYHAMTALPSASHAVVFEISGHVYEPGKQTKQLAPFAPSLHDGLDGDPAFYADKLLPLCGR